MSDGLNSAERVLATADALTRAADTAQAWIKPRFDEREINAAQAHELFTSVNQVRAMANLLYTTAAAAVVKNLGESQRNILATIGDAEKTIAKIATARDMIDLVADLIAFAAAINTGKPGSIIATMNELKTDVAKFL